jgi:hypothetical protein
MLYQIIGWVLIIIAVIAGLTMYLTLRKFYPIAYMVSLFTYIFTLVYVIDVYDLSKNLIILFLGLSAIFMLAAGFYISRKIKKLRTQNAA